MGTKFKKVQAWADPYENLTPHLSI